MSGQKDRLNRQLRAGIGRFVESNRPLEVIPKGSQSAPLGLYHYTIGRKLGGGIMETQSLYPMPDYHSTIGERPVVWFSLQAEMEPTAAKGILSPDGDVVPADMRNPIHLAIMKGMFRFLLKAKTKVHNIYGYKVHSHVKPFVFNGFISLERQNGRNAERDWYVSFVEIPLTAIERIDTWTGEQWEPLSDRSGFRFKDGVLAPV